MKSYQVFKRLGDNTPIFVNDFIECADAFDFANLCQKSEAEKNGRWKYYVTCVVYHPIVL